MKYLERKYCKQLLALGCESESGVCWTNDDDFDCFHRNLTHNGDERDTPAFTLEDILNPENAIKIFGKRDNKGCPVCGEGCPTEAFVYHRHSIIDVEDWTEYLKKFLEERKPHEPQK